MFECLFTRLRLAYPFTLVTVLAACANNGQLAPYETYSLDPKEPVCECPPIPELVCPPLPTVPEVAYKPAPKPKPKAEPLPKVSENKVIIGELERFTIYPWEWSIDARVDTGATTSSIHSEDLTYFERDGKRWVRFNLVNPKTKEKEEIEKRVKRRVIIKATGDESDDRRPVVEFTISLGAMKRQIEVTLADRQHFDYKLLVGRNFLRDLVVVDVSRKFVVEN